MIHILTEDSAGGYQFWETLCRAFKLDARVLTTYGAAELYAVSGDYLALIDRVLKTPLNPNDILIICYDRFNKFELDPDVITKTFKTTGVKVFLSSFDCIETVILGFEHLQEWLGLQYFDSQCFNMDRKVCIRALEGICKWLYSDRSEDDMDIDPRNLDSMDTRVLEYIYARQDLGVNLKTPEDLCADLLAVLTYKSGWKIDKSSWHECWTSDCCWDIVDTTERCIERRFAKNCRKLNEISADRRLSQLEPNGASLQFKYCELIMFSQLRTCFILSSDPSNNLSLFGIIGYPDIYEDLLRIFGCNRVITDLDYDIVTDEDSLDSCDELTNLF